VKLKSAEIAKAKETGDKEGLAKLDGEFRDLRTRQDEAKAVFDAARAANTAALDKLKALRAPDGTAQN